VTEYPTAMSDDQQHPERGGDEPVEPTGAAPASSADATPAGDAPASVPGDAPTDEAQISGASASGDAGPADARTSAAAGETSAAGAAAHPADTEPAAAALDAATTSDADAGSADAPGPDDGNEPAAEAASADDGDEPDGTGDDDSARAAAGEADTAHPDDSDRDEAQAQTAAGAKRRRFTVAGAFIGVLLGLLGFALVVQLRSNAGDAGLANERPEDLVQILSDLDARQQRLRLEIANLQSTKAQLEAGSQSRDAALKAAAQRADELGILAGTLAAQGPGVVIKMFQGSAPIKASVILDTIEELRDAGAEAMQIDGGNGVSVRIIASTYFVDGDNGAIESDGKTLSGPFSITAIGDPQTLQPALNIAGGVVDTVEQAGGTVTVTSPATVTVATTVTVSPPKYAEPAN